MTLVPGSSASDNGILVRLKKELDISSDPLGREAEADVIYGKLTSNGARAVIIEGVSGRGKTWLLYQVFVKCCKGKSLVPAGVSLESQSIDVESLSAKLATSVTVGLRQSPAAESEIKKWFEFSMDPTRNTPQIAPASLENSTVLLFLDDLDKSFVDGRLPAQIMALFRAVTGSLPYWKFAITCKSGNPSSAPADSLPTPVDIADSLPTPAEIIKDWITLKGAIQPFQVATFSPQELPQPVVAQLLETHIPKVDPARADIVDHRADLIMAAGNCRSFGRFPVLVQALVRAWNGCGLAKDACATLAAEIMKHSALDKKGSSSDNSEALSLANDEQSRSLLSALIEWNLSRGIGTGGLDSDSRRMLLISRAAHRDVENPSDVRIAMAAHWLRIRPLDRKNLEFSEAEADLIIGGFLTRESRHFVHDLYKDYFDVELDRKRRDKPEVAVAIHKTAADSYRELIHNQVAVEREILQRKEQLVYHLLRQKSQITEKTAFGLLDELTLQYYAQFRHSDIGRLRKEIDDYILDPINQVRNLCERAEIAYNADPASDKEGEFLTRAKEVLNGDPALDKILMANAISTWCQLQLMQSQLMYESGRIYESLFASDHVRYVLDGYAFNSNTRQPEHGLRANTHNHLGIDHYKLTNYQLAIHAFLAAQRELDMLEDTVAQITDNMWRRYLSKLIGVDRLRIDGHVEKMEFLTGVITPFSIVPLPDSNSNLGLQELTYRYTDRCYAELCALDLEKAEYWWDAAYKLQVKLSDQITATSPPNADEVKKLPEFPKKDGTVQPNKHDRADPWVNAYLLHTAAMLLFANHKYTEAKSAFKIVRGRFKKMGYGRDLLFAKYAVWCCEIAISSSNNSFSLENRIKRWRQLSKYREQAEQKQERLAEFAMRYVGLRLWEECTKADPTFEKANKAALYPDHEPHTRPELITESTVRSKKIIIGKVISYQTWIDGDDRDSAWVENWIKKLFVKWMDQDLPRFTPPIFIAAMLIFRSSPIAPTNNHLDMIKTLEIQT